MDQSIGLGVELDCAELLHEMFTAHGLELIENEYCKKLIVNAKEEKQMHRIWIQAKYRLPKINTP
jgi:hypothetical protein